MKNSYIELPPEEQLRIARHTQNKQERLLSTLCSKTPQEQILFLIDAQTKLIEKYEGAKWFDAERNKNTTNELVINYEVIIDQLKKQIR